MEYNQFLFSQLFMVVMLHTTEHMAYDEVHPALSEVYQHWLLTDALYGDSHAVGTYGSIDNYLKSHADGIKHLLSK